MQQTALPGTAWIAEIDLHVGGDGEALVVSHLLAAIPGQGAAQFSSSPPKPGSIFVPKPDIPFSTGLHTFGFDDELCDGQVLFRQPIATIKERRGELPQTARIGELLTAAIDPCEQRNLLAHGDMGSPEITASPAP